MNDDETKKFFIAANCFCLLSLDFLTMRRAYPPDFSTSITPAPFFSPRCFFPFTRLTSPR
jgi:hypothetical protein